MAIIWNLLSILLALTVNFILICPVMVLFYEVFTIYLPLESMLSLKAWIHETMAFLHLSQYNEELFFTVLMIMGTSLLTSFMPYCPVLKGLLHALREQKTPNEKQQAEIDQTLSILYAKGLEKDKYKFFVMNCPEINAFASGANEITITSRMLEEFPPKLIAGVVAHEIGHHIHGDVKKNEFLWGITLLSQICLLILKGIGYFCIYVLRFIPFLGIVTVLFGMLLFVVLWFYTTIMNIPVVIMDMFFHRRAEYAADDNALKLGLGKELLDAMVIMTKHCDDGPWWKIPWNDHPRAKSRIARIRKKLEQAENMKSQKPFGLPWKQKIFDQPAYSCYRTRRF